MSKKKSYGFESNGDEQHEDEPSATQAPPEHSEPDPNQRLEYTVLTDGAMFKRDQFSMKKADVPAKEPEDDEHVVCQVGDRVRLTQAEADTIRASGVALGGPILTVLRE